MKKLLITTLLLLPISSYAEFHICEIKPMACDVARTTQDSTTPILPLKYNDTAEIYYSITALNNVLIMEKRSQRTEEQLKESAKPYDLSFYKTIAVEEGRKLQCSYDFVKFFISIGGTIVEIHKFKEGKEFYRYEINYCPE